MAPWVFKLGALPSYTPGLTVSFLLWLIVYALYGFVWGILLLQGAYCSEKIGKKTVCVFLSYVCALVWYPLFFSVLHSILAALFLLAAIFLQMVLLYLSFRRFLTLMPFVLLSAGIESYYLVITIGCMLL